jgi:hypothetical protein
MKALVLVIVFLVGGFCGMMVEKRQSPTNLLGNTGTQIEHVQTPAITSPIAEVPKRKRKQSGL